MIGWKCEVYSESEHVTYRYFFFTVSSWSRPLEFLMKYEIIEFSVLAECVSAFTLSPEVQTPQQHTEK